MDESDKMMNLRNCINCFENHDLDLVDCSKDL